MRYCDRARPRLQRRPPSDLVSSPFSGLVGLARRIYSRANGAGLILDHGHPRSSRANGAGLILDHGHPRSSRANGAGLILDHGHPRSSRANRAALSHNHAALNPPARTGPVSSSTATAIIPRGRRRAFPQPCRPQPSRATTVIRDHPARTGPVSTSTTVIRDHPARTGPSTSTTVIRDHPARTGPVSSSTTVIRDHPARTGPRFPTTMPPSTLPRERGQSLPRPRSSAIIPCEHRRAFTRPCHPKPHRTESDALECPGSLYRRPSPRRAIPLPRAVTPSTPARPRAGRD